MIPSKTFVVVKFGAMLAPPQSVPSGDRLTLIGVVSPPRTWTSAENFRNPFFVMSTWCIPSAKCTSNRSPGADPRQDSPSIVTSAPDGCTSEHERCQYPKPQPQMEVRPTATAYPMHQ